MFKESIWKKPGILKKMIILNLGRKYKMNMEHLVSESKEAVRD